jgi:hypothetical protein
MTSMRHYPPAHVIHEAGCPDAPTGRIAFRASGLRQAYPNGVPHSCFTRETVYHNREVVAEAVEYESHPYQESGATQPDAVRPLCRICRGTHPDRSEATGFVSRAVGVTS